ncbi:LuxR C-terminal-related transcriptional regulator [Ornithinibacillus salinisoli]|uniref:LuxR C-terminal-related transcriptional regulator n=1 Tax=Ornithinibacillus salinisoli TaxID=1848459 RepID=A0ABW4VZY4_9BACI
MKVKKNQELDTNIFVGRHREIEGFKQFLQPDNHAKILNIYGSGGIGKSYLLSKLTSMAEGEGILTLTIHSEDFIHTPKGFATYLLTLLDMKIDNVQTYSANILQNCQQNLSSISTKQRIFIALDDYEKMDELDSWFRHVFIRHSPQHILFAIAGREELKGEWKESPAWRKVIQKIELQDFDLNQTSSYLTYFGITDKESIYSLWQFTEGHPLTLSLATITNTKLNLYNKDIQIEENIPKILMGLTKIWLEEVSNEKLQQLVKVAAVLHRFDQEILSYILKEDISLGIFNQLTNLSFVKSTRNGWAVHDLIRDSIQTELKHHDPDLYDFINSRSAEYYYQRTIVTRSEHDIAQFFYHLDVDIIQSTFFTDSIDTSMYFEQVAAYNSHELEEFFTNRKHNISESDTGFYNRGINKSYRFTASLNHNKKELELINADYIKKMGYDVARLLKDENGEILGLSVIVPINKNTLEHLAKEPVSRAFFSRLNENEKKAYAVSTELNAGWFIRLLDYTDTSNISARSFSLYNLFPLLLTGGKIILSTPLPFFQELCKNFGFQEVPHAKHFDYGENNPSTTYLLDLSGPRLAIYLKQFLKKSSKKDNQLDVLIDEYNLTARETEIVNLILEDKRNAEIAKELFVAEVTIKKHISRILSKVGVKNRTQLIKRILEHNRP